jgi:hypothetical protein
MNLLNSIITSLFIIGKAAERGLLVNVEEEETLLLLKKVGELNFKDMGNQIIKQPNGKYCIFISIVDSVTYYNMTENELIKVSVKEAKSTIVKEVKVIINQLKKGEKPYHQFTMNYEEMLQEIKTIINEKEMLEIKELIEKE